MTRSLLARRLPYLVVAAALLISASLVKAQDVVIEVGSVVGGAGETVTIEVTLDVMGSLVAETWNAVAFDPLTPIVSCVRNEAISKDTTRFLFRPVGCTPGDDCESVKAGVLSLNNRNPIPDGAALYFCDIAINRGVPEGFYPLTCSIPASHDPAGAWFDTGCSDGEVVVSGIFLPSPTPTPTPTPQVVHLDVGSATGLPGSTVVIEVTIRSSGLQTVATANDIMYWNRYLEAQPEGCRLRAGLDKGLIATTVPIGDSSLLRVFVESGDNATAIPDGLLYTCPFLIYPSTPPGQYPLDNVNVAAFDPHGQEHSLLRTGNGAIVVSLVLSPNPTPTRTATPPPLRPCIGDCDDDHRVSINELIKGVLIALGNIPVQDCSTFDANHDQRVTVAELILAVGAALEGCPV